MRRPLTATTVRIPLAPHQHPPVLSNSGFRVRTFKGGPPLPGRRSEAAPSLAGVGASTSASLLRSKSSTIARLFGFRLRPFVALSSSGCRSRTGPGTLGPTSNRGVNGISSASNCRVNTGVYERDIEHSDKWQVVSKQVGDVTSKARYVLQEDVEQAEVLRPIADANNTRCPQQTSTQFSSTLTCR